jgi:curved DNA-binding protein CbpA
VPNGTRVRDWATVDYYALLGVEPSATVDDVARAFRTLAKQLHPDARLDDPHASERFKDLAAAYTVLSDRATRRDYDRVRAEVRLPARESSVAPAPLPASQAAVRKPWSRRRAWTVIITGVLLTILGVVATGITWHVHDRDAQKRALYVPVTATRAEVDGRRVVLFETPDGRRIQAPEPQHYGDPAQIGQTVRIRYDPKNPLRVIPDATTFGRDITLAIVALKLLIGGPIFIVYGTRRLSGQRSAGSSSSRTS